MDGIIGQEGHRQCIVHLGPQCLALQLSFDHPCAHACTEVVELMHMCTCIYAATSMHFNSNEM